MAGLLTLVTATLAWVAAAGFAFVGVRLVRIYRRFGAPASALSGARVDPVLLLLAAATLLPMGLREIAQWAAQADLAWQPLETALFQALHVPAALGMVLLMHLTARQLSGSRKVAAAAGALYLVVAGIGLGFLYGAGHAGVDTAAWDVEGSPEREALVSMVLGFFALPALLGSGMLILAVQRTGGADARRYRMLSLALSVFYMGFTLDAIGASGGVLLWPRVMTACAAGLAYLAYFPAPARLAKLLAPMAAPREPGVETAALQPEA